MFNLLWKPYMEWCLMDSFEMLGDVILVMLATYWLMKLLGG